MSKIEITMEEYKLLRDENKRVYEENTLIKRENKALKEELTDAISMIEEATESGLFERVLNWDKIYKKLSTYLNGLKTRWNL